MKRLGPLGTLLAGGVLAAGFGGLNAWAAQDPGRPEASGWRPRPAATPPGAVAPSATAAPSATPRPTAPNAGDVPKSPVARRAALPRTGDRQKSRAMRGYAGYTHGRSASVSFVTRGRKVVAYLCDGKAKAAWLRGSVTGGRLRLVGEHGAHLTGESKDSKITGSVSAAGTDYRFTVMLVNRPAGLYRLSGDVRGAQLRGGWNVLPGGRQMGLLSTDGKVAPAPAIDLAAGTVRIDGRDVPVQEVMP